MEYDLILILGASAISNLKPMCSAHCSVRSACLNAKIQNLWALLLIICCTSAFLLHRTAAFCLVYPFHGSFFSIDTIFQMHNQQTRGLITALNEPQGNSPDSFAERANSYYHERPQLLALLDDLYNGYLSLADRYCQVLAKTQHQHQRHSRCSSPIPQLKFEETTQPDEGDTGEVIDSDAESSLSFQPPTVSPIQAKEMDADIIVADLVMKTVEYDIVLDELAAVEKRWGESSRKLELQKNLLDVLESERLILLNDNATLGYRVTALVEENKGLVSESMFLKRKAAELARCVLKTREDHRVCMLSRKIEDLQGQIYGLEKRNKEYYEQLVKQEEKSMSKGVNSKAGEEVNLDDCFQESAGAISLSKCFSFNAKKVGDQIPNGEVEGKRVSKLWDKVKKFELFQCGPHFNSASS